MVTGFVLWGHLFWCCVALNPVGLSKANPRYLEWGGKPRLLVTSSEHFGALINLDFDYRKYLQTLSKYNFTLTQTWTGAYVEPDADVGPDNTLDPRQPQGAYGSYIAPWARTRVPGNAKGGGKFDLKKFNSTFFSRMKDFVQTAGNLGIVVELGLFGGYEQTHETIFETCPFYSQNNVNNISGLNRTNVYTLNAPPEMLEIQLATVKEIALSLKDLDNHYFQIISVASPDHAWGKRVAETIKQVDPQRLISAPAEWPRLAEVGVTNYGALASPTDVANAIRTKRGGVLAYDESGGLPGGLVSYRRSYWSWAMAGGGIVDNLDWSYMYGGFENGTLPARRCHESGNSGAPARQTLAALVAFLEDLDLAHMTPDLDGKYVSSGAGPVLGLYVPVAATTHIHRQDVGQRVRYAGFVAAAEVKAVNLSLSGPCAGHACRVSWINTTTGAAIDSGMGQAGMLLRGCMGRVDAPPYTDDVAFRVYC